MKKKLLRTFLVLAVSTLVFSCVDFGLNYIRLDCILKKVVYDQPPTPTSKKSTRARICPFPLTPKEIATLVTKLGTDKGLYKIKVWRNGEATEMGSLSSSIPAAGQSQPDLDQELINETDAFAKQQVPSFNGVTVQAGRGRGGQAPMNNDADIILVERLKAFFDSH